MNRMLIASAGAMALMFGVSAPDTAQAAEFVFSFASDDGTEGIFGTVEADLIYGTYFPTSANVVAFGTVSGSGGLAQSDVSFSNIEYFFFGSDQFVGLALSIGNTLVFVESSIHHGPTVQYAYYYAYPDYVSVPGKMAISMIPDSISRTALRQLVDPGAAGAVPEPAGWAMMILGVGAIGASLRAAPSRRRLRVSYA